MANNGDNKNPFQYFWDMATSGLFSDGSDTELTPDPKAGKKGKHKPSKPVLSRKNKSKHSRIDSNDRKKAG